MKIKWKASISYAHGEIEIDDEDFEGMDDEKKTVHINKIVWDEAIQCVDYGWEEMEGKDEEE